MPEGHSYDFACVELAENVNLIKFCKTLESRHVISLDHSRGTSERVGDLQKGKMFPARQQVQARKGTGVCLATCCMCWHKENAPY